MHIRDIAIEGRRLPKTRLLRHQNEHPTGVHAKDLPVFLVNPTRFPALTEDPEPERDFRKLAVLYTQPAAALALLANTIKAHLASLRTHLYDLAALWQRESVKDQSKKLAVAAFLASLALLSTLDRPRQPIENDRAAALRPPQPVFDLDQRLAFAQNLRDRLLFNAIVLSMQTATPAPPPLPTLAPLPIDRDPGQISTEAEQFETPTVGDDHDTSGMVVPQISADDDAKWRFPFDSRPYIAGNLPRSPDGSFRVELAMSDVMTDQPDLASVAENENASAASVPKAKENKPTRRKKAVVQKRRAPQDNQKTAAAPQPAGVPGEPNLPPPPILFFLGAPPPQPTQPAKAPRSATPAATNAPPPAPPPAYKPWVPNSLSDVFKDAY